MTPGSLFSSVIIATYNRCDRLAACLDALARQTKSEGAFEVVVVDDGSTDGTEQLLASLSTPLQLRHISQGNQGQCVALNRGAAKAGGEQLIFLDDDIVVSPVFMREHQSLFTADRAAVGVGQMLLHTSLGADWFSEAFGESWRDHYERLGSVPGSVTWRDCYGGNMSVSRERFLRAGGFATDLARGYDLELALRLQAGGCRFVYLPQAVAQHDERKNFKDLIRDAEAGGRGAVLMYRRHPEALALIGHFPEQTIRVAFVLRAILRSGLSPVLLTRLSGGLVALTGRKRLFFDLVHRYAYWRGVKKALNNPDAWEQLARGTIILMYHGFCLPGESAGRFLISPDRFARQMRWLRRRGYRVLELGAYAAMREAAELPPRKSVLITIDDGYAELTTIAAPVLGEMGYPAAVFLPTAKAGQENDWDPDSTLRGRRLLSWPEVRLLLRAGITCGAHGTSHRALTALPPEDRRAEIAASQADFQRETGAPAASFAYPYGEFEPEFAEELRAAGYRVGLTVEPGANTPLTGLHTLRRVEIRGGDSTLEFAYALATGRELRAELRRTGQTLRSVARGALRGIGRVVLSHGSIAADAE